MNAKCAVDCAPAVYVLLVLCVCCLIGTAVRGVWAFAMSLIQYIDDMMEYISAEFHLDDIVPDYRPYANNARLTDCSTQLQLHFKRHQPTDDGPPTLTSCVLVNNGGGDHSTVVHVSNTLIASCNPYFKLIAYPLAEYWHDAPLLHVVLSTFRLWSCHMIPQYQNLVRDEC